MIPFENYTFHKIGSNLSYWSVAGHPKHNITASLFSNEYLRQIDLNKIYTHPNHPDLSDLINGQLNATSFSEYDVSIFKTKTPFTLGSTIMPACLFEGNKKWFEHLIAAGHGYTAMLNFTTNDRTSKDSELIKSHKFFWIDNNTFFNSNSPERLFSINVEQIDLDKEDLMELNLSINVDQLKKARGNIYVINKSGPNIQPGDSGSFVPKLNSRLFFVKFLCFLFS